MSVASSQINNITFLTPKGDYETFADEQHYSDKVREWGLSTTKEVKKQFLYKEKNLQFTVTVKGYEIYEKNPDLNTVVIEFQDGNLCCIHPAYLKEMQASSFGKGIYSDSAEVSSLLVQDNKKEEQKPKKNEKKEKTIKLELPEEKVHFSAEVKQFALSWNNFNEENDEVIILENVVVQYEAPINVGLSWCSHSKTLKKFELAPGDLIEFDGKIVKKKLPKGKEVEEEFMIIEPVLYKINNPSKIKKG